jgi:hypothetical protein
MSELGDRVFEPYEQAAAELVGVLVEGFGPLLAGGCLGEQLLSVFAGRGLGGPACLSDDLFGLLVGAGDPLGGCCLGIRDHAGAFTFEGSERVLYRRRSVGCGGRCRHADLARS